MAPENTLEGIGACFAAGADGFECDVRITRDGRLVLMHDPDVARTTDGTGRVADLTFDQVRALDAGYRFAAGGSFPFRGRGIRVPALEEVLEVAGGRGVVILEVKGHPFEDDPGPGERALETLLAGPAGRTGGVVVSSLNLLALARVRESRPELPTAVLTAPAVEAASAVEAAVEGGHAACHLPDARADAEAIDRARAAGLEVVVWTVNDPARIRELSMTGADGVISDDPALAVAALGDHGER